MANFNDVQTEGFSGFLGGVLNSDKQHYSDLNKSQQLLEQSLNNVKREQETTEFLQFAPTREAENALKLDTARRKLPMVQEMLNSDLEGKKAEAAYKLSHGRLYDAQASTNDYADASNRMLAIRNIVEEVSKRNPEEGLRLRMQLNPAMQALARRMTSRPQGEIMGSDELNVYGEAAAHPAKQAMALELQKEKLLNAAKIAAGKNDTATLVALIHAMSRVDAANARGGKPDKNSFESRLTSIMTRPPATRYGALKMLKDEAPDLETAAKIQRQIDQDIAHVNADPARQRPGDAPKGSPVTDTDKPKPAKGDLPPGVERVN